MTEDTQTVDAADFNLSLLDPNALEEPKESFPVKVIVSRLRWSDPRYNAATSFRGAFPYRGPGYGPEGNSVQQWELLLERLDAVKYHEDGSPFTLRDGTTSDTAPVLMYAGIDLEKMDKNGAVKGIMKTRGKEPFVLGAWTKVAGSLVPDPSVIEGKMFRVERFREKEIAPGFFAKNIIVPTDALPPTFVHTGEVLRFKARPDTDDAAVADAVSGGAPAGVSKEDAAKLIADYFASKGIDAADADVSILGEADFPAAARIEPFLTAIATGQAAATLASFGQ